MAVTGATMQTTRDLFFQNRDSVPLEMFVKVHEPRDFHFYCKEVSFSDFALAFENEVRSLECLVYRIPPSLLNPNYWEPLTRETEAAVREKMAGIITRQEGERAMIWRSDAIAPGRLLRDGLDTPVDLLHGYIFKVSGEGLLKVGRAWSARPDPGRFDWIGYTTLPPKERLADFARSAHADLTAFRSGPLEQRIAYTAHDDRSVRLLFWQRAGLRRAVSAAIRGFFATHSNQPNAAINERVAEQLIRHCDGLGFTADPSQDFIDRQRTHEVTVRLGRTEWGIQVHRPQDLPDGDHKVLIYYDRISGMWAVAS